MKYGYKVVRRLSSDALRALCVERAWYTSGDNSAPMLALEQYLYSVDEVGNIDDEYFFAMDIPNEFYSLSFDIRLR